MRPRLQNGLLLFALAVVFVAAILLARHVDETPRALPAAPATEPRAPAPTRPDSAAATPPERASSGVPATAAKRIDVCGRGMVDVNDQGNLPDDVERALLAPPALTRAIGELAASAKPADRAIALYLQASQQREQSRETGLSGTAGCADDRQCRGAVAATAGQTAQPYTQTLVDLAARTDDPVAYAIAYLACSDRHAPAACSAITAQRWAALEPDNGMPWLYAAAEAKRANDSALERTALERAAQADRFDAHAAQLLRPITTGAARDARVFDRLAMQTRVAEIAGSATPPNYIQGVLGCVLARDPALREGCSTLASRLVERNTDRLGIEVGVRLGSAMGWPPEKVAALFLERDAIGWDADQRLESDLGAKLSCGALASLERRNALTLESGHMAAARAAIKQSGRPIAELAAEHRASVARNAKTREKDMRQLEADPQQK